MGHPQQIHALELHRQAIVIDGHSGILSALADSCHQILTLLLLGPNFGGLTSTGTRIS